MTPNFVDYEFLSRSPLLAGAERETLLDILRQARRSRFDPKQIVCNRGEMGTEFHIILSGGVKVSTLSRDGKELIFDVLGAGDFFGEMSALDDKPRTSTVTALVPSVLLTLDQPHFLAFLNKTPTAAFQLLRTLTARLRQMDAFLEDVLFLDAETRLAKRMLALARIYGKANPDGNIRISVKMSQQEMANLVGITRESVNKQFKEWERSGVIRLETGCIVLREPQLLGALAAGTSG